MPKLSVQMKIDFDEDDPAVVLQVDRVPRGSGNAGFMERLGQAFHEDPTFGPYVIRHRSSGSRLLVFLVPSLKLSAALMTTQAKGKADRMQQRFWPDDEEPSDQLVQQLLGAG